MSGIALAWVASVTVGNQTAKQLLQFYAGHNFGKPGFEFKNETLARQLEVKERAIQRAHKLLIDKKLIIKEKRFNEDGRQLTNSFYLNIPQEFVDNYMGEGVPRTSLGVSLGRGEGVLKTPLYNNKLNNKLNTKSDERLEGFDTFWASYPRKENKDNALKAWKKRECHKIYSSILYDVQVRRNQIWKNTQKEFIPMASTYINGARWNDEIVVNNKDGEKTPFKSNETKSTVKFYEPGHPDYDRIHGSH